MLYVVVSLGQAGWKGLWSNVLDEEEVDGGRLEGRKDGRADAPQGLPALLHRDQDKCGSASLELSVVRSSGPLAIGHKPSKGLMLGTAAAREALSGTSVTSLSPRTWR
jgi:hypothetical protein